MDFRVVSQCPPLCSLSSHAAAICPILIIIHKHNKTGFPLSFIYSVVIQIHYLTPDQQQQAQRSSNVFGSP